MEGFLVESQIGLDQHMVQVIEDHAEVHEKSYLPQHCTSLYLRCTLLLMRGTEIILNGLLLMIFEKNLKGKVLPVAVLPVHLIDVLILDHREGDLASLSVLDSVQHYRHEEKVPVERKWDILEEEQAFAVEAYVEVCWDAVLDEGRGMMAVVTRNWQADNVEHLSDLLELFPHLLNRLRLDLLGHLFQQ